MMPLLHNRTYKPSMTQPSFRRFLETEDDPQFDIQEQAPSALTPDISPSLGTGIPTIAPQPFRPTSALPTPAATIGQGRPLTTVAKEVNPLTVSNSDAAGNRTDGVGPGNYSSMRRDGYAGQQRPLSFGQQGQQAMASWQKGEAERKRKKGAIQSTVRPFRQSKTFMDAGAAFLAP
jgi:hypothetical protein